MERGKIIELPISRYVSCPSKKVLVSVFDCIRCENNVKILGEIVRCFRGENEALSKKRFERN